MTWVNYGKFLMYLNQLVDPYVGAASGYRDKAPEKHGEPTFLPRVGRSFQDRAVGFGRNTYVILTGGKLDRETVSVAIHQTARILGVCDDVVDDNERSVNYLDQLGCCTGGTRHAGHVALVKIK